MNAQDILNAINENLTYIENNLGAELRVFLNKTDTLSILKLEDGYQVRLITSHEKQEGTVYDLARAMEFFTSLLKTRIAVAGLHNCRVSKITVEDIVSFSEDNNV